MKVTTDSLLTITEAMALLKIKRTAFWKLRKDGKIKPCSAHPGRFPASQFAQLRMPNAKE